MRIHSSRLFYTTLYQSSEMKETHFHKIFIKLQIYELMGDSKEISKSLIEEGDVYQKVDLAFKVQIKNTNFSFILLFLVLFRITLRSCFYPKGEKSLSIKHQRSLANKRPSQLRYLIDWLCCTVLLYKYSLALDFIIRIQTSISVSIKQN